MLKFPMQFEVEGESSPGIETLWSVKTHQFPPITCSIPEEFRGPGGAYSPEDLLGLASISCLIATFKVFASMSSLSFDKIAAKALLTIDRPQGKGAAITQLKISLKVYRPSDSNKAQQLLEEAKKNCLVTNALAIEKVYQLDVE